MDATADAEGRKRLLPWLAAAARADTDRMDVIWRALLAWAERRDRGQVGKVARLLEERLASSDEGARDEVLEVVPGRSAFKRARDARTWLAGAMREFAAEAASADLEP